MASAAAFGVALAVAQLIGLAFLIAAIFAPSYHYQFLALPGGAQVLFDLSLFRTRVSSACVKFGYTLEPDESCLQFVNTLNGKSLGQVSNVLCGIQAVWFNLVSTGCDEFSRLSVASTFYLVFLAISAASSLLAVVIIIAFFTCAPVTTVRKAVIGAQGLSLIVKSVGDMLYFLIGGSMQARMFIRGFQFHGTGMDFSFGSGAAVGLCATVWCWTLPLWSAWAIKLKYCEDYYTQQDLDDEEADRLVAEIRREAAKLDPATANAIMYPVTSSGIISWVVSPAASRR